MAFAPNRIDGPHKGDGELQSLCRLHHESAKKREEARGYSTQIGDLVLSRVARAECARRKRGGGPLPDMWY